MSGAHLDTGRRFDPRALWIGVLAGLTAILCCVSPVVLVLVGIASASEAISLGEHLYAADAWYFRAFGVAVGAAATVLYLRRRQACSLRGARSNWRTIAAVGAVALLTYAALYVGTTLLAGAGGGQR